MSQTNYVRLIHAVASYCPSTAVLLSAHQSIGVPQPLKMFGTEEQKKKWLPRLAKGAVSAFALTEPDVGSDPAQMSMIATPTEDGNHYILNGTKLWTTNGVIAELMVVMALTPPKKLPDGREKKQITAFVVERDMPGFSVLHRCDFMGLKGIQNGLLKFENVKVPKENILWGTGKGLKLALVTLNTGRLTLPAACTATARTCLQVARTWATEREQWGGPIGTHESSAGRLLFAAGATYTMESVGSLTSGMADQGNADIRIEASLGKLFSSGLGWRVVDQTLQLRGGRGYETARSLEERGDTPYPIEQIMRDFRINMIIEGTSSIQRLFVAREALDKHLKLAMGLFNPKASIGEKLSTLVKAGMFYAFWYPKLWICSMWPMYTWAGGWEGRHLRFVANMSKKIARKTFHAMALNGPALERKQRALGRIVDSGMFIFALSAVLSRYLTRKKNGKLNPKETELVKKVCRSLRMDAKIALAKVRIAPGKSQIVSMSKSIMNGDLAWLEEDIADVVGLSKARQKPELK
ncbi:MAG: acyl-CoA dehydrogenase family protein [Bdellovibrionota bacterium]